MQGKIVQVFEATAVYLCTGCKEQVQLDDAIIIHSDGIRCLCLRCIARHHDAALPTLSATAAYQIEAATAGANPPNYDWPVW